MQRGGAGQGGWSIVDAEPKAPTDTFSVIFSRTELIIGASRAKSCEEVDGEVRLSVQPPKLDQKSVKRFRNRKISPKTKILGEIFRSQKSFYAFLGWFWRIYGKMDLTIDFLAVFRSRCTYYELCTTKNCQNNVTTSSLSSKSNILF